MHKKLLGRAPIVKPSPLVSVKIERAEKLEAFVDSPLGFKKMKGDLTSSIKKCEPYQAGGVQ